MESLKTNAPEYDLLQQGWQPLVEEAPFIYNTAGLEPGIASELSEDVYKFEKAWQEAPVSTVFDMIGQPFYLAAADLDDDSLEDELIILMELLEQHNMSLEIPDDISPRQIYRFITEFLFEQEIDDLKLDHLSRRFIYSDHYLEKEAS